MTRHLVVFWVLLFDVLYAGIQAQTAIWKFPTKGEVIQANAKDTVLLDWTSTLPSTILRMWCPNETDPSNSFALASSFYVDSTGPFKYVIDTYDTQDFTFPLSCHAELAADPIGSGVDSPETIAWSSDSALAVKTISQTQAASSVTITVVSTPSPSPSPTLTTNTKQSGIPTTSSTITDSLSQPTTPPSSTTLLPNSSETPAGATGASQRSSSTSVSANPNNTGPIVGGTIGGIALVSFIVLALLFLRKYQRDHPPSSITEPSSTRGFHIFNVHKIQGSRPVFEKERDNGAHEKEGSGAVNRLELPHELQGSDT